MASFVRDLGLDMCFRISFQIQRIYTVLLVFLLVANLHVVQFSRKMTNTFTTCSNKMDYTLIEHIQNPGKDPCNIVNLL